MAPKFLLPTPQDNVAIVTRRIEAGERLDLQGTQVPASAVVLPGHRLCVQPIRKGEALLSWGLPFGTALCDIAPGDYICNAKARDVLLMRNPEDYASAPKVNFADRDTVAERILPEAPEYGRNRPDLHDGLTFDGFHRGRRRGWGTRNYLVLIGVTSRSRAVVLQAARTLQQRFPAEGHFDGVVPVVHTEGGGLTRPNNLPLLIRTLAGFALNPNVGVAILVNDDQSVVTDEAIAAALRASPIAPDEYSVHFFNTGSKPAGDAIDGICELGASLVPVVAAVARRPAALSGIRLGLQCGGSDAFSGVTANQVLGKAVHQLIRRGGSANLAETDELIGAEQHVLQRVADRSVHDRFLAVQQRFKDYAKAHGSTAEGNVSGGNIYRGLYNITLKSLGAARKKDPDTAVDYVIDYGEPMAEPGYYFMDSPGNDLESIAGQVAAGVNLILFTTGNGSITNHPFVPTIKIVTTNERYALLASDMDFNAGQVMDGVGMDEVAQALFESVVQAASGQRTKGERTGQYQTQIWRNWHLSTQQPIMLHRPKDDARADPADDGRLDGVPLLRAAQRRGGHTGSPGHRYALILPTSLCSGQVAEQIAQRAAAQADTAAGLPRVVALPHTEGCGVSGGNAEEILRNTLIGYATHPLVDTCVFLEHGCEKTHNDYFRSALEQRGIDPQRFHWASIQLEGGIAAVSRHVEQALAQARPAPYDEQAPVHVGLAASSDTDEQTAAVLARLAASLLQSGTGVVIGTEDPLLKQPAFLAALNLPAVRPTLRYAQEIEVPGLHIMDSSSTDWLEIATGLGASGCRCLVVAPGERPWQAHRFLPTLQVGPCKPADSHMDYCTDGLTNEDVPRLVTLTEQALRGDYVPKARPAPNVGFQISRGRFGVSL